MRVCGGQCVWARVALMRGIITISSACCRLVPVHGTLSVARCLPSGEGGPAASSVIE